MLMLTYDSAGDDPESKEEKKTKPEGATKQHTKVQRVAVSNARDQQEFKSIRTKLIELETMCINLKVEFEGLNNKELSDKINELLQGLDKKASILDLKKLYGTLDGNNERFESIKKDVTTVQKSIKDLEDNEEGKAQKLRIASLESKIGSSLKAIRDIQTKMADTLMMQIVPQQQQAHEEDKKEDKMSDYVEEINDKLNKMRDAIAQFKADFASLSKAVDDKIESRSSKESLIDLESRLVSSITILQIDKLYREIDKVVAALSKRFGDKPDAKRGIKALETQVKQLYEMCTNSMSFRENADDPLFIKKPLGGYSCAACEKDVSNMYALANQGVDYITWNKMPVKDSGPKVL